MPPKTKKQSSKANGRGSKSPAKQQQKPKKRSAFLCDYKYRNNLPDIPFQPKFLRFPFDADRWYKYKLSLLEQNYKHRVHIVPGIAPDVHLIDPTCAEVKGIPLAEEDRKLLRKDDDRVGSLGTSGNSKRRTTFGERAQLAREGKPWLVKTQYIDNDLFRTHYQSSLSAADKEKEIEAKRKALIKDETTLFEKVVNSFNIANAGDVPRHKTKPHLTPVKVFNVIPHVQLCRNDYYHVNFGDSKLSNNKEIDMERVNRAFLQQFNAEDESTIISYLLPTGDSDSDEQKMEWIRDYSFNIKPSNDTNRVVFCCESSTSFDDDEVERGTAKLVPLEPMNMELKRKIVTTASGRPKKRIVQATVLRRELSEAETAESDAKYKRWIEGEDEEEQDVWGNSESE